MSEGTTPPPSPLRSRLWPSLLLLLLGGLVGGWGMHELHERKKVINPNIATTIVPFHQTTGEYTFIQPLLFCRLPESTVLGEKDDLKQDVEDIINGMRRSHPDFEASVYYRDLNRGRWIGVNEEKEYTPASLLKVIIMITYFKEAELDPQILERPIVFTQDQADLLARAPLDRGTELALNTTHTVDDLIERMITTSDNGATYALLANVDNKNLNQVYRDLELENPDASKRDFTINAREYSYFLRILFNATYLERSLSERALSLLNKTEFNDGLTKGIPTNILVSHKYGESISAKGAALNSLELHDCGIIYHPKNPYLLCIMTRGQTLEPLLQGIQAISKKVYEDVSQEEK